MPRRSCTIQVAVIEAQASDWLTSTFVFCSRVWYIADFAAEKRAWHEHPALVVHGTSRPKPHRSAIHVPCLYPPFCSPEALGQAAACKAVSVSGTCNRFHTLHILVNFARKQQHKSRTCYWNGSCFLYRSLFVHNTCLAHALYQNPVDLSWQSLLET